MHLTGWSWYWAAWVAAFLGPEMYWVFANARNTLSDTVWTIEGLRAGQPFDFAMWTDVHWAVAALVWALFLWLSLHIPFGLLR